MQNDLISRSALLEHIKDVPTWNQMESGWMSPTRYPEGEYDPEDVISSIENAPAVDAVEVDKAMAWLEGYTMTDTKQIYSNGIVYVPMFRVEQAFVDKAYNGLQEG